MCKKISIPTGYIYPKKQKMAVLNECTYKNLARILTDRIGKDEFFNGSVFYGAGGVELTLRTTLLIYRCKHGRSQYPVSIVPVWYECEVRENGRVISNEFSWQEFKKFLPSGGRYI